MAAPAHAAQAVPPAAAEPVGRPPIDLGDLMGDAAPQVCCHARHLPSSCAGAAGGALMRHVSCLEIRCVLFCRQRAASRTSARRC